MLLVSAAAILLLMESMLLVHAWLQLLVGLVLVCWLEVSPAIAANLLGWKEIRLSDTVGFWVSKQMLLCARLVFHVCLLPYGLDACSREPIPFDFRLFKGVCSLCLGLSVYIYCWSPACLFFIYTILTFDRKKNKQQYQFITYIISSILQIKILPTIISLI
jgi:hypothetical protein